MRRRYNGFGMTVLPVRSVPEIPVPVPGGIPDVISAISASPAGRFPVPLNIETFSVGPQGMAASVNLANTRTLMSMGPVLPLTIIQDPRAERAREKARAADDVAQEFSVEALKAQAQADADRRLESQARADQIVRVAQKAAAIATQAAVEAADAKATTNADEMRIRMAADQALAESERSRQYYEEHPRETGGSPPEEPVVTVPLENGGVAAVTVKPRSVVVPAAAAGAIGFLLGGPIGALVGVAAGYFVTKPKKQAVAIAFYR
jgi:hypothetical protein